MVIFENVSKRFGSFQALTDVSGEVLPGQVIVVCGPSGSGKSTLMRTVNHLEPPDSGRVIVDGVDASSKRVNINLYRRNIGFVAQQFNLFPHLTALGNVMEAPMTVKQMTRAKAEAIARHYLERVGLSGKEPLYPSQLSGGQQQRVAIARALAMEPDVVLFDEPTSALDPKLVREVGTLLRSLDDLRKTLVVVSHDMDFARAISDQVIYFEGGRAVESGTAGEVFGNPQQPETRAFMACFQGRS